jgi:hypothetical protein
MTIQFRVRDSLSNIKPAGVPHTFRVVAHEHCAIRMWNCCKTTKGTILQVLNSSSLYLLQLSLLNHPWKYSWLQHCLHVTRYGRELITTYKTNVHTQSKLRHKVTCLVGILNSLQLKCSGSCQVKGTRIKLCLCLFKYIVKTSRRPGAQLHTQH